MEKATKLYQVIQQETCAIDRYMAEAQKGVLYVPELALVHFVWRAIMKERRNLFGDDPLTSSWEASWGKTQRIDLVLGTGADDSIEHMLFEFKVSDTSESYIADLFKLAPNALIGPHVRCFFCALVDEFPRKACSSDRIKAVLGWKNEDGSLRAEPVVPEETFMRFLTRHPTHGELQCIVTLFEIVPVTRSVY